MKPIQNCCGQCAGQDMCQIGVANCCVECHMAWEEENAAPYLPPHVLAQLQREHNRLLNGGLDPKQLRAHSQWEERIFQTYCPQGVCDQVLVDHEEWEAGRLTSREKKPRGVKKRLLR